MKKLLLFLGAVVLICLAGAYLLRDNTIDTSSRYDQLDDLNEEQQIAKSLIGHRFTGGQINFPGVTDEGSGGAIGNALYATHSYHYVSILGKKALLLERNERDEMSAPISTITDVLLYSPDEHIESLCGERKSENWNRIDGVFGMANSEEDEYVPSYAWKANLKTEKFEDISPEGIVCINYRIEGH